MSADPIRLPPQIAARLRARVEALAPLGTVFADGAELDEAERSALAQLAERLEGTYPFGDAMFAGQMLKPPAPVAWAAYAAAMLLNPNNHALDGGPATADLEREAVAQLAQMLGLGEPHLGHLSASGTIANLEALWVARQLRPGEAVLSSVSAHYTHARMCELLGVAHEPVAQDAAGRIDLEMLERRLAAGGVGTVVATLGTTALGALDPVAEVAGLCERHGARLHVDAAYGGYFATIADGAQPGVAPAPFAAVARADSVVIDPHKHGLQPYGCGCVLFADPAVGRLYAHDSPYTYFTSGEVHPGEITLECSRAGAAAAALWATIRARPLTRAGIGRGLADSRAAALEVARLVEADERLAVVTAPELDIVAPFSRRTSASAISAASERAFGALAAAGWHVAKLRVETPWLRLTHPEVEPDAASVTVLRCCLMKPEHLAVAPALAAALGDALAA